MKNPSVCILISLLIISSGCIYGQCPLNQDSVTITIETENHGFGIYWQLVEDTNECGVNPIFTGGNLTQMNCNSAGLNITTSGNGYGSFSTIVEGPWCLNRDSVYSIRYIEDRGGFDNYFTVNVNGYPVFPFITSKTEHLFTFTVAPPLPYNVGMQKLNLTSYMNPVAHNISGTFFNYSANTITDVELCYSINGATPVSQLISGLNILPFTTYDFVHPVQWMPVVNGTYDFYVWCQTLNGNADMDHSNDSIHKTVVVGNPIPNIIDHYLTALPSYTIIGDASDFVYFPSDLDFHTILSRNELWVLNMGDSMTDGSTVTFYNASDSNQVSLWRQDNNSHHFFYMPSALAFSDNTNFGVSDAVLDAHHNLGHFAGPTLWSSDSLVYALPGPGPLGSHIDMLHQSPFAMGIAADHDNAFWVYDGYNQRITYYDFVQDHGPGFDDHSDGIVRRYDDVVLNRINDSIPNHLVLDEATGWLYVVDNGNQRVLRMDINTGTVTGTFPNYQEPLAEHSIISGTTWNDFITTGIVQPAGIDIIDDRMIVSDYSNGDIIVYDKSGSTGIELGRIHTNTPGVAGVKIGPDGRIWYVNQLLNTVVRVDTSLGVGLNETISTNGFIIYPNPADKELTVFSNQSATGKVQMIKVFNAMGKIVYSDIKSTVNCKLKTANWTNGIYFVQLTTDDKTVLRKVVISHH